MKFYHTVCELCGNTLVDINQVIAFIIDFDSKMIRQIELNQQPWCGVRCVCKPCVSMIQGLDPVSPSEMEDISDPDAAIKVFRYNITPELKNDLCVHKDVDNDH